jgi:hypothetical protein
MSMASRRTIAIARWWKEARKGRRSGIDPLGDKRR